MFGLARNARLVDEIAVELIQAEDEAARTGRPARRFKDFRWSTRESWSRRRRVIGKTEWTGGSANVCALRRIGLNHAVFAEATAATIRLKLLKVGALVTTSVRRVKIAMASAHPLQQEWQLAHARLRNAAA